MHNKDKSKDVVRLSHFTIERAGDSILWLDANARLVRVNEAATRLLGYSNDELLARTLFDVIVDYDMEKWRRYWDRLKRQKVHSFESEQRTKNGTIVPVRVTNNYFEFEGKEYVCSFVRDVSQPKAAEAALEESNRLLEEAQRIAHLGRWSWDIATNTVWWSDELYRIYGLDEETFAASYEGFLERVHPDDLERVKQTVQTAFEKAEPMNYIHRLVRPDGSVRSLHARAETITDGSGNPVRMVGTALDVTELKEAEEEIRKLNEELERRVQDRTAELETAVKELKAAQARLVLQEKMAALGALVAGVAHEINNPVGAIKSATDVSNRCLDRLTEIIESGDAGEVVRGNRHYETAIRLLRENVGIALTGSDRVATIVKSLKAFARLDDDELVSADINEGLDSTLTLLQHELKNRVEVIKEYGDLPPLDCYAQELNQVFMNILVNGIQAIDGEGSIHIRTSADDICVHVAFSDSGRGIPPDVIEHIFDPGFTTKGVGVGTGLGLSISYNIVEKHRGKIDVDSVPGKGTTFTLHLPRDLGERLGTPAARDS